MRVILFLRHCCKDSFCHIYDTYSGRESLMPVPGIGYSRDEYRLYRSGKQFRAQYLQDNYLFEGFPGPDTMSLYIACRWRAVFVLQIFT